MGHLFLAPEHAAYVLRRIAEFVQTCTKEISFNEVNLEHIFPKKPAPEEWGGPEIHAELEVYLWHIENLTVLGERLNDAVGNKDGFIWWTRTA